MSRGLVILVAAAALVAVPLAAADANYTDPAGDANGAPDVIGVVVANDSLNRVAFEVELAGQTLPDDGELAFYIDSDQSVDTGMGGWDFIAVVAADGSSVLLRWDGAAWVDAASASARAYVLDTYVVYGVDRAELGNTAAFDFVIEAAKVANNQVVASDLAPNDGDYWSYATVTKSYGLAGSALTLAPKAPAAGKKLTAQFLTVRTDSLELLADARSTCKATLAGKAIAARVTVALGLAECVVTLPKTAKGKLLKLTVTTSAGGKSVARTYSGKVR